MPSPNNKYKSKKARLEEYYKNPNVQAYLAGIRFTETGNTELNWNAKNPKSTARGPYQFLDSSQKDILNNWGVNAYSNDPKEVHLAALGLMAYKPQGLESIKKGDFKKADTMYNKYWTSLPGGAEPNVHTPKLKDVRARELTKFTKPAVIKPTALPAPEPGYFEKFMTGYNAPFNDSKTDYNFPTRFIGGLQEVFGVDTNQPTQKQKHGGWVYLTNTGYPKYADGGAAEMSSPLNVPQGYFLNPEAYNYKTKPKVFVPPAPTETERLANIGRNAAKGTTEPMIGLNDPILLSMLPPVANTALMGFNVGQSLAGGNYEDAATQALLMAAPPIIGSAVKKGISYAGQGAKYLGSEIPAMATKAGNYIKTKTPAVSNNLEKLSNKLNEIERNVSIRALNSKPALKARNSIIQYLENQSLKDPQLSVFDPKKLKRFKRLGYVKGLEGELKDPYGDFESLVYSKDIPYTGRTSRTSLRNFLRDRYFEQYGHSGNFVTSNKSFSSKVKLPSENMPGELYDFNFFNDNPYSAGRTAVQLEKLAQNIPGKWTFDPKSLSGDSYPMWVKLLNKQNTGQFEVLDPQYISPLNTLGRFSPLSKSYREYGYSEPNSPNWITNKTNYIDEVNNLAQSVADKYGVRVDPDVTKSTMMYPRFILNKKYRTGGTIPRFPGSEARELMPVNAMELYRNYYIPNKKGGSVTWQIID